MKVQALTNELKQSRQTRRGLLILGLFILLSNLLMFSLLRSVLPTLNSIGPQGSDGKTVQGAKGDSGYTPVKGVDYFDGRDGTNGKDGQSITGSPGANGANAQPCTTQTVEGGSQITCPDGSTSFIANGASGENSQPARQIEKRCTQLSDRIREDFRYGGDLSWQVEYYGPEGSTCP